MKKKKIKNFNLKNYFLNNNKMETKQSSDITPPTPATQKRSRGRPRKYLSEEEKLERYQRQQELQKRNREKPQYKLNARLSQIKNMIEGCHQKIKRLESEKEEVMAEIQKLNE